MDTFNLEAPLRAVGALLERRQQHAAIVVVGGTALNLLGVVSRATADVDVIAIGVGESAHTPRSLAPAHPLPPHLLDIVETVARDFGLPGDWMNAVVGGQWTTGLPFGFAGRVTWQPYQALSVGLPGRIDLIFLKLYAAADDVGPSSRHYKDLIALGPTEEELTAAAQWVRSQDPSPAMDWTVAQVIEHVTRQAE